MKLREITLRILRRHGFGVRTSNRLNRAKKKFLRRAGKSPKILN